MIDGDFAVGGTDITKEAISALPSGPGIGPKEAMVKVPRQVMLAALSDILSAA
jgi:hypothetical protein